MFSILQNPTRAPVDPSIAQLTLCIQTLMGEVQSIKLQLKGQRKKKKYYVSSDIKYKNVRVLCKQLHVSLSFSLSLISQ